MLSKWRALPTALVYFFLLYNHAKNIPPTTFNFRPWLCPIDGLSSSKWMSHCCHQSKSSTLLSLVVYITRISSLRISSSMLLLLLLLYPISKLRFPTCDNLLDMARGTACHGHGYFPCSSAAWVFHEIVRGWLDVILIKKIEFISHNQLILRLIRWDWVSRWSPLFGGIGMRRRLRGRHRLLANHRLRMKPRADCREHILRTKIGRARKTRQCCRVPRNENLVNEPHCGPGHGIRKATQEAHFEHHGLLLVLAWNLLLDTPTQCQRVVQFLLVFRQAPEGMWVWFGYFS